MRSSLALTCMMFASLTLFATSGCSGAPGSGESTQSANSDLAGVSAADAAQGKHLFENETFGGNGRTCATCHTSQSGSISPDQIGLLYRTNPDSPIFRSIDSDDGVGNSYSRLLKNATIRITLDLPPNIRLHDNPTAKTFTVNRSTPTFINSSLFQVLMWDGREPNLQSQALGAVHAHTQNTVEPSAHQLDLIAAYERTQFSSEALRKFSQGGPAPTLPDGHTDSEKRGRVFFDPDKQCGSCHSGALLNTTTASNPLGFPPGNTFATVFAGYEDFLGFPEPDRPNPIVTFDMDCDPAGFLCNVCPFFGGTLNGNTCTIAMPDPGLAIASGNPDLFELFKTPMLWNVKNTAPYFHDNSAATLEDVMSHYDKMFLAFTGTGFTSQEQADIVAYMKLL